MWQVNGFSPVCILMWRRRCVARMKRWLHTVHRNGRSGSGFSSFRCCGCCFGGCRFGKTSSSDSTWFTYWIDWFCCPSIPSPNAPLPPRFITGVVPPTLADTDSGVATEASRCRLLPDGCWGDCGSVLTIGFSVDTKEGEIPPSLIIDGNFPWGVHGGVCAGSWPAGV